LPGGMKKEKIHYLDIDKLVGEAKSRGNKLKFIASFEDGKLKVYPKETSPDDPLFVVDDVKNVFIFYTKRYSKYPLSDFGSWRRCRFNCLGSS
jgi:aspartokinase/homoserine dehydrogenase 1